MTSPHVASAAQAIRAVVDKNVARATAYRVEGRGMLNGRALVRRDGETVDDAESYAVIVPSAPTPGFDAVFLMAGGKEAYLGMVHQGGTAAFDVGIGQTVTNGAAQSNADNPSTTNTATFVNAMALTWALPDGVYDFTINGSFLAGHTASDLIDFRVSAGATVGTTRTRDVITTVVTRLMSIQQFTGITVSGGITFVIEYKRGDALVGETASARNPALHITATRKG